MRWKLVILAGAWLAGANCAALAASFDCAAAKSDIEILICLDYRLAWLDEQLADEYRKAVGSHPEQRDMQRAWLQRRNDCKKFWCIVDAYVSRIGEVNHDATPVFLKSKGVTQPWQYWPSVEEHTMSSPPLSMNEQGDIVVARKLVGNVFEVSNLRTGEIESLPLSYYGIPESDLPIRKVISQFSTPLPFQSFGNVQITGTGMAYRQCGAPISEVKLEFTHIGPHGNRQRATAILWKRRIPKSTYGVCEKGEAGFSFHFDAHPNGVDDFTWRSSYFARVEDGVIRFDRDMSTEAEVVGKEVLVVNQPDFAKLITGRCPGLDFATTRYGCVERTLGSLFTNVSKFH